ncbi:MAG: ATP-dependent metallopeptidase FtsH/Yme1/Tma family protein [Zetaproteobacteria bacterium]|nr:MAG: ATP-dependent metallopeptidase FtsH/Yme1/Tma family protein [Zetaproteobacteria bacterium]
MNKQTQINFGYLLLAMIAIFFIQQWLLSSMTETQTVPFSQFEQYLKEGKIDEVVITEDYITGKLKESEDRLKVIVAARVDPSLIDFLDQYGVTYTRVIKSHFLETALSWLAPTLIFFGIWLFFVRRMAEKQGLGGGFVSIGKSRAKVFVEKDTGVSFDDVAGVDEAKLELQEVVEFLQNPQRWGRLGARIPKGVLLVGPPGTGKTLLAKAVAGEAGVPFFSISGSEFVEMFVGVGAARVRDLFEQARKHAPAIIFIDELDALGRSRTAGGPIGGHDEREQTLNQLLVEMDGFDPSSGLVILAATNRPEILDPALLRAGRFDRQVLVDRPDKPGREAILRVHMKRIRLQDDVDAEKIAALTTGFSGADLENLVNEAALLATRENADAVSMTHFTRAIERLIAGLEKKNRVLGEKERRVVAYHEMGHALVAMALPGTDPVHKVSIIPRGIGALGYTIQRPTEDRYLMTREELQNKISVLLGGRAAEQLVFGHLSTGAADDLAKATDMARDMVMRYGMDEDLGFVVYDESQPGFLGKQQDFPFSGKPRFSEETARKIDDAVRNIINRQFDLAMQTLRENRDILERCAQELLRSETLEEDQLKALTRELKMPDNAPA